MVDERRDSSRTELESRPTGGVRAGGATSELRSAGGGLSRMERHGGGSSAPVAAKSKVVPSKTAKLTFEKKPEKPVEADDALETNEDVEEREYPKWATVSFWLFRKSIVPVVMIVMLAAGLYVGYVIMGKAPEDEVFDWATWQHLYDLVFAES
ncbi:DNA-directed RNA polymerase subunit beta [Paenibacillus sp. strain BS8-2]